jgi:hypothetical protein
MTFKPEKGLFILARGSSYELQGQAAWTCLI